jgi:4-diphosphocytidyl-2-C-methyl-D-erythritol kinase
VNPDCVPIDWHRALPAPAKLNLFLHVIGRRSDGYHLLQTAFRLIDRSDRLTFFPREDGAIRLENPVPGVADSENLVIRAAQLLQPRAGRPGGVTIRVEKILPTGGGLGGGSSDAATTLLALNCLWDAGLTTDELAQIGVSLGADVPVFIHGENAFGEGIGERLTPIAFPEAWYLVLTPQVCIHTRDIFDDTTLTRDTQPIKIAAFFAGQQTVNDLEPVVRRRYPAVAAHLDWLSQFSRPRLTGSGACVFAEFRREDEARAVLRQLPPTMHGFVAKGLERHPLMSSPHGQLGSSQVG